MPRYRRGSRRPRKRSSARPALDSPTGPPAHQVAGRRIDEDHAAPALLDHRQGQRRSACHQHAMPCSRAVSVTLDVKIRSRLSKMPVGPASAGTGTGSIGGEIHGGFQIPNDRWQMTYSWPLATRHHHVHADLGEVVIDPGWGQRFQSVDDGVGTGLAELGGVIRMGDANRPHARLPWPRRFRPGCPRRPGTRGLPGPCRRVECRPAKHEQRHQESQSGGAASEPTEGGDLFAVVRHPRSALERRHHRERAEAS